MLNKQGFDLWADNYDQTVQLSEEKNEYPFAGYKVILNNIFNEVMAKMSATVLDIGIGTGVLAKKLYDNNHQITGVDFSEKMLENTQLKMLNAQLINWDIGEGVPEALPESTYDFIISTYTLHHLTDAQKVQFIKDLSTYLKPNGQILIGDISFETQAHLQACKVKNSSHWDDDEFYFVFDEFTSTISDLFQIDYEQISECGGLFKLSKK